MTTIALLLGPVSLYILWLFYLAVMSAKRAREAGTLTRPALILATPLLWLGLLLDLLVNIVVCTVLFLEFPKELLVTARVSRLQIGDDWRSSIARWMCHHLLDPFDPSGCHCK